MYSEPTAFSTFLFKSMFLLFNTDILDFLIIVIIISWFSNRSQMINHKLNATVIIEM